MFTTDTSTELERLRELKASVVVGVSKKERCPALCRDLEKIKLYIYTYMCAFKGTEGWDCGELLGGELIQLTRALELFERRTECRRIGSVWIVIGSIRSPIENWWIARFQSFGCLTGIGHIDYGRIMLYSETSPPNSI